MKYTCGPFVWVDKLCNCLRSKFLTASILLQFQFNLLLTVLNEIHRGNRQEKRKNIYSLSNPGGLVTPVLVKNLTVIITESIL